jgi:N-acetylglutamate synthase-like GNAT family acetyltransferase
VEANAGCFRASEKGKFIAMTASRSEEMQRHYSNYLIRERHADEPVPYDLLLLADPSPEQIDTYLPDSRIYLLEVEGRIVGIGVWQIYESGAGEVLNLAVAADHQNQGFGKAMLQAIIVAARQSSVQRLLIATGNSSIGQIALYQQQGFDLIDIDRDYFVRLYPDPIWENGIQCRHQLIFQKRLNHT